MQLRHSSWRSNATADVSEIVSSHVRPDYADDRLDMLRDRTDEQAQFVGRLVKLLHDKGVLSDDDVVNVLLQGLYEKAE